MARKYLTIHTRKNFDAAHYIPKTETKCQYTHGHTFTVDITIFGLDVPEKRMMVDFIDLKKEIVKLDHTLLNDTFQDPTAENLARFFANKAWDLSKSQYPHIISVTATVYETPDCDATITITEEEFTLPNQN